MRTVRSLILFSLVLVSFACAKVQPNLSLLGTPPDWNSLESFQETVTREQFLSLLEKVYAPGVNFSAYFQIAPDHAKILNQGGREIFRLRFARDEASRRLPATYWRAHPIQAPPPERPLGGLRIAIDPGHLGGDWAAMEERWFRVGRTPAVAEGDLTLQVAKLLEARLTRLGAEVFLVRRSSDPLTPARPQNFLSLAVDHPDIAGEKATREESIRAASELLFYRVSEIRRRAELINGEIKPDLVLCLHFNAEDWGDPQAAKLVDRNHLHLLVNGAYTEDELAMDDVRFELLGKLLGGTHGPERRLSEKIAQAFVDRTGLLPCHYPGESVKRLGPNPYLWGRNLLANRLYQAPVIYLEPYVMNHPEVFERIQLGDYEGKRRVGDRMVESLFREYAEAVTAGLLNYFSSTKKEVHHEGTVSTLAR